MCKICLKRTLDATFLDCLALTFCDVIGELLPEWACLTLKVLLTSKLADIPVSRVRSCNDKLTDSFSFSMSDICWYTGNSPWSPSVVSAAVSHSFTFIRAVWKSTNRISNVEMSSWKYMYIHRPIVICTLPYIAYCTINFAVLWNLTKNAIFRPIFGTYLFIS